MLTHFPTPHLSSGGEYPVRVGCVFEISGHSCTIGEMQSSGIFRIILLLLFVLNSLVPRQAVQADDIPDSWYITGFKGFAQNHHLSCESRSATDLAAFWGVHFTEDEFLAKLPVSDDPDQGFVGNVDGTWGYIPPGPYGVHALPILKTLKAMGLKAREVTGMGKDDLKREIVAGRPVIVWVIGGMWYGSALSYTTGAGRETLVARYEHTMVVTGYNEYTVRVVDAGSGWTMNYYWSSFMSSWSVLGNMSVVVDGKAGDTPQPKGPSGFPILQKMIPQVSHRFPWSN